MPNGNLIGMDFARLIEDPLLAELTYHHEMAHSLLMNTTEFGICTISVYENIKVIERFSPEDKEYINKVFFDIQINTQESSATLMEILALRNKRGPKVARDWAKQNFPLKYYEWFKNCDFVLDLSSKYRELFTKKIPHLAMHNGIREAMFRFKILDSVEDFNKFINDWENKPDIRFRKLIETVKGNPGILNKTPQLICDQSKVKFYPDTTKLVVAGYLNYLEKLKGTGVEYKKEDIKDGLSGQDAVMSSFKSIIIGNMNLEIAENGIALWNVEDLLHYKDQINAVLVNLMPENMHYKEEAEAKLGKNLEVGLLAFLPTGEKFILGTDNLSISDLTKNEFREKTLLMKFGLYDRGYENYCLIGKIRKPDVIIHNTIDSIIQKFSHVKSKKILYLYIGFEGHPFRMLVMKDDIGILHILNFLGNRNIESFLNSNKKVFVRCEPHNFIQKDKDHFNNACSIWMGISWNIDYYQTLIEGKVKYRIPQ